jgi:hypothetical protein
VGVDRRMFKVETTLADAYVRTRMNTHITHYHIHPHTDTGTFLFIKQFSTTQDNFTHFYLIDILRILFILINAAIIFTKVLSFIIKFSIALFQGPLY